LTDLEVLRSHVPNWRAMLRHGLEAGGTGEEGEALAEAIEARLRTGRLLGADEWIAAQEETSARRLTPAKRGPKSGKALRDGIKYTVPGIQAVRRSQTPVTLDPKALAILRSVICH
jgi:urease accessory protein UreF